MKQIYSSLFSDAIPALPMLPPLFEPLFEFIETARRQGLNVFGNGAGKTFISKLLALLPMSRYVRTSTTTNSEKDWCGVKTTRLRGVVDVAVVSGERAWILVGEIKGGCVSSRNTSPGVIGDVYDGALNNALFSAGGFLSSACNIYFQWNTDGVSLFSSSSYGKNVGIRCWIRVAKVVFMSFSSDTNLLPSSQMILSVIPISL